MALVAAAEVAIQAVEQERHEGMKAATTPTFVPMPEFTELYRQRIGSRSKTGKARKIDEIERKLRLVELRAERTEFYHMARARQLSDETAHKLVREVDLLEARFGTK
jgi:hypothetical protein